MCVYLYDFMFVCVYVCMYVKNCFYIKSTDDEKCLNICKYVSMYILMSDAFL